ncbi:MAG: heme ABC exporter ATP-binding protein CcmA [Gemmatimonadales bacterium]
MTPDVLPLVAVRGVERRFGRIVALAKVSLEIEAGEVVLLLGPNGAGKSTLLRCIAGLARPLRGSVRVAGRDVHADPAARAQLGFLSHQAFVYDDLTARENLRFAAALYGLDGIEHRVQDALDGVGLTRGADTTVGGFSRGMLQRLSIARATIHQPPLLLLDEPFTGLDAASANDLRHRIAAERSAGRGVICVTHEPGEAWLPATRVVVLVAGKVVLDIPRPDSLEEFRVSYARAVAA